MSAAKKASPCWSDVKTKLAHIDRSGLLGLLRDLYAASKDNRAFLHSRFSLGDDVLTPYKEIIDSSLWPDVVKNEKISVTKAKKAISDYKKAIGKAEGLAELMVFFCERASGFSNDFGLQDESYANSLVRVFEQALKTIVTLSEEKRPVILTRLEEVCRVSRNLGYGIGDDMDDLLAQYDVHG